MALVFTLRFFATPSTCASKFLIIGISINCLSLLSLFWVLFCHILILNFGAGGNSIPSVTGTGGRRVGTWPHSKGAPVLSGMEKSGRRNGLGSTFSFFYIKHSELFTIYCPKVTGTFSLCERQVNAGPTDCGCSFLVLAMGLLNATMYKWTVII